MVYNGKSHVNRWFRGTPISGNFHIELQLYDNYMIEHEIWVYLFGYLWPKPKKQDWHEKPATILFVTVSTVDCWPDKHGQDPHLIPWSLSAMGPGTHLLCAVRHLELVPDRCTSADLTSWVMGDGMWDPKIERWMVFLEGKLSSTLQVWCIPFH